MIITSNIFNQIYIIANQIYFLLDKPSLKSELSDATLFAQKIGKNIPENNTL
jgi:hypothetical protein